MFQTTNQYLYIIYIYIIIIIQDQWIQSCAHGTGKLMTNWLAYPKFERSMKMNFGNRDPPNQLVDSPWGIAGHRSAQRCAKHRFHLSPPARAHPLHHFIGTTWQEFLAEVFSRFKVPSSTRYLVPPLKWFEMYPNMVNLKRMKSLLWWHGVPLFRHPLWHPIHKYWHTYINKTKSF
jgi:hypothetical protein